MKTFWKEAKDYIIIIVCVILVRTFIVTPAIVDGPSMDDTLADGQLVFINKFIYRFKDIERFDIVVVDNEINNDKIIKRVIGLPNETIEYRDNKLYINGTYTPEAYRFKDTADFIKQTKDNEYLVLGDNRPVSQDSRQLGNFTKENILGRVKFRVFPFTKFGIIR